MKSPRTMVSRAAEIDITGKAKEVGSAMIYEVALVVSTVIIFPLTASNLGPADYGRYTTIYVIAGFALTWVYASGGAAVVQLLLQRNRSIESAWLVGRRQVVLLALPFSLAGVAVSIAVVGRDLLVPALLILTTDLLIAGLAELNLSVVYATNGTSVVAKIRSIGPILRTGGILALAALDEISIITLVINNMVPTIVVFVLSRVMVTRILRAEPQPGRLPTDRSELARLSATYALSISTNTTQNEGEKLILASFRPASEVGEYQAAYRLVTVALLPWRAVSVAASRWFLPQDDRRGSHTGKAAKLTGVVVVYGVACALAVIAVRPITSWFLGPEFQTAVTITVWLCAVPLLQAAADIPTMGLLGLGRNRTRVYLGLGGAAVALVAYLVMIPLWGWRGAVAGTYVSEIVSIAAGWVLLVRCQRARDQELDAPANRSAS